MEASGKIQGSKKTEDKTQASDEEDLSMEEILQSIRRIIADDETEGNKPVAKDTSKSNGAKEDEVPGSDVLELTEMLKDDGTIETVKPASPPAKSADTAPADILNTIDKALTPEKTIEKPVEMPESLGEKLAAAPPVAPVSPAHAPAAPFAVQPSSDSLLSAEAASAAASSIQRLKSAEPGPPPLVITPPPHFRSGNSVEDMVADMLRPMMKSWLDNNLPQIVERIVEREVKKLTKYLTDTGD